MKRGLVTIIALLVLLFLLPSGSATARQQTLQTRQSETFSNLADGTYAVTPSKSGYPFSPSPRTIRVPENWAGVDFADIPSSVSNCFSDEFSTSSLSPGWIWVDPLNDSSYSLTTNAGSLRIQTPDGNHDLNPSFNTNAPRLVQSISGNFDVATKVSVNPTQVYQASGILVWFDGSNFVWTGRSTNNNIGSAYFRAGQAFNPPGVPGITNTTVYLRITRNANTISTYYSLNGSNWTLTGSIDYPSSPSTASVGMFLLNNHQNNPISADFDYFRCAGAPTVSVMPVNQSSDDAGYNYLCGYSTSENEIYFGRCTNGNPITSGFRFRNVSIPPGATITEAHLEFTVDGPYTSQIAVKFFGEKSANAATFSSTNGPHNRTLTTASVPWSISDQWNSTEQRNSPNLAAIVQEIVNLSGWASGNSLAIIDQADPAVSGITHRRVFAWEREDNSNHTARLVVSYSVPQPDTTPPAAITNLSASTGSTIGAVNLSWTTPGDDGNTGIATQYIVRHNSVPITEGNWGSSVNVVGEPSPGPAGSSQSMTVSSLTPGQRYYFAIKTQDEVPNTSALSNSPSALAGSGSTSFQACTGSKIYLPIILRSGGGSSTSLATTAETTNTSECLITAPQETDANGETVFNLPYANVQVILQDITGQPVEGMRVVLLSDGVKVLMIAEDPDGQFYPTFQEDNLPPTSASLNQSAIPLLAIVKIVDVVLTGKDILEIIEDHPTLIHNLYYTEACFTVHQLSNILALTGGFMVPGFQSVNAKILKIAIGQAAPPILEGLLTDLWCANNWDHPMTIRVYHVPGLALSWHIFTGLCGTTPGNICSGRNMYPLTGYAQDVRNLNPLEGAYIFVKPNGPGTYTNYNGYYQLNNVPVGFHTVNASKAGYVSQSNIVNVTGPNSTADFLLSPISTSDEYHFVLTWGANPNDLDSHLWLPSFNPYHIYFQNFGQLNAFPFAALNYDDTVSFGPETITMIRKYNGTYTYAVHHYAGSGSLATSGAQVAIYRGNNFIGQVPVPTLGSGTWWIVATVDGTTGSVTKYNYLTDTSPVPYASSLAPASGK